MMAESGEQQQQQQQMCQDGQTIRNAVACKVCGQPSMYTYYMVRCCESCKQFFRRILVKRKQYWCARDGTCEKFKNGDHYCSGCRLDRCLLAGMQPRMAIGVDRERHEFVQKLLMRKNKLLQQHQPQQQQQRTPLASTTTGNGGMSQMSNPVVTTTNGAMSANDWQKLDHLLSLEVRQKTIWSLGDSLPDLSNYRSAEELVEKCPDQLFVPSNPNENDKSSSAFHSIGSIFSHDIWYLCIDELLMLEWAKKLPFFDLLTTSDQVALLTHISLPFQSFLNAFYSATSGADTWIRCSGFKFISNFLTNGRLRTDEKLKDLVDSIVGKSVTMIKELGLCREEFVLLQVILLCSSTPCELSGNASELLYAQSVEYARLLMAYQQGRYGPAAGAAKYANCIHLLGTMIRIKEKGIQAGIHLDLHYTDAANITKANFPKPFPFFRKP